MLTYHFESADDIPENIVDDIKAAFRSKAITIVVEETDVAFELTDEMKSILDQRIEEPKEDYISAAKSLEQLREKHGL
jgi:hypothetical protein